MMRLNVKYNNNNNKPLEMDSIAMGGVLFNLLTLKFEEEELEI